MQRNEIAQKVDEFSKWVSLAEEAKKEIEKFKDEFTKLGVSELENKKIKQVEYWGTKNVKVVVTESETLKVQEDRIIEQLFSKVIQGNIKIEPSYKYSEPFKRILISLCKGTYVNESFNDVIRQVPTDEETKKVLKKKLKGNWEKDINTLKSIAKLNEQDAEHWAWCIKEALNYEKIIALFRIAGYEYGTPDFENVVATIKAAAIVEESIKVGVEAEEVA